MLRSKNTKWRRLENAAKIFPATSNKKDERVFRISCELYEMVDAKVLQKALERTMDSFTLFSYVLRKGLFWNYFEESELRPLVREEYKIPCSRLYEPDEKKLLFEVTYYKYRINLEVFHALTDGTGLSLFLRTLVYEYLILSHKEEVKGPLSLLNVEGTDMDKGEDGFKKYYEKRKEKEKIPQYKAHQFNSPKIEYGELKLMQGVASTKEIIKLAKSYETTVTGFLTAVFLCAIEMDMSPKEKRKPVALMIPVNLRNFFPSYSARNFFGWIDIGYDFKNQSNNLAKVSSFVQAFFQKEITKERMATRMNGLVGIERNFFMRVIPLEIKALFVQLAAYSSTSRDTAILSNIGKITMPQECKPYIRMFDFYTSTPKIELCTCSYEDKLAMSFTTAFESTNILRNFFRILTGLGVEIELNVREVGKEVRR